MWNPFKEPKLIELPKGSCVSESGRVEINLPIPESTGTKLGIYLSRLETWCAIAGISHLRIDVSSATNDNTPQIAGVDHHGHGIAGLTLSSSTNFSDSNQSSRIIDSLKMTRAVAVEINLRTQEILRTVSETSGKGIRDTKALAEKIDYEIRKALLKEGLKFLLTNFSKPDFGVIATRLIGMLGLGPLLDILINVPLLNLMGYLHQKTGGKEFRISLFAPGGPELDRALIFAICLLTQTLVEPILEKTDKEK